MRLILFTFPHSWWMNLAQDQIYNGYARNATCVWNWNWTELKWNWPLFNISKPEILTTVKWRTRSSCKSMRGSIEHKQWPPVCPVSYFDRGKLRWIHLKSVTALAPAGNMGKVTLGILPSYPAPEPPFPKAIFSNCIHIVLLTCFPRDYLCPLYNFIPISNLKLLFPFPPGLDWSSTPRVQSRERSGLAIRNMSQPIFF